MFVVAYLWAFPYFGALRSANELPRVLLSDEIVRAHTFRLDARLGEFGSRFDLATTPDQHWFSNKAPGVSLLGAPVMAVARPLGVESTVAKTWLLRVLVVSVPCLLFLILFWELAAAFAGDSVWARRLALLAYAMGSMALPYGVLFFSHALSGVCAGGAFVLAVRVVRERTARPTLTAALAGLLAGAAVLVDYQALLASLAVGVYLLVRAPAARRWRSVLVAGVAAALPLVLLLAYHAACFGSPWKTGYSFAADPAHKQGVLGIIGPNARAMWNALLAPDNGLVVLAPWVLLAALGGVAIARDRELRARLGAEALVCGAVAVMYLVFVGSLVPEFGRAGWSVGPRYIGVAMPFCAWLAAAGLAACAKAWAPRVLAAGLVLVGVVVHVLATVTYPHWPTSFKNPLYEVSVRALGEGLVPHSLGTALGLPGVWSLAPLFAGVLALVIWALAAAPGRRRAVAGVAAVVLAGATIAGYGAFPRAVDSDARFAYVRSTWEPRP